MRGHVQPVSKGVWRLYIENGRDPLTGRRRRITRTFHGTKKQAEEEASKLVIGVREGRHTIAATTVGALLDAWLESAEPNLAASTLQGYRAAIRNYIRPALGTTKLSALNAPKLDAFYRELHTRGAAEGGPLSAQTIQHVHSIIHRACEQGRRWGWLDRNPSEFAQPPRPHKTERILPGVADVIAIAEHLHIDMRELVWVALVTGARRGELVGLRWTDLRFEADGTGRLNIARAIPDVIGPQLPPKSTKTGKERRPAIDELTVALLKARHARKAALATECGVTLDPLAYMFADDPTGHTPLRPGVVSSRWIRAREAAGVHCRFHDLRHMAVTELLEAGFEVGGVAKRVGHSSTKMTSDVYQHSRSSGDLDASRFLAGLLTQPQ